LCSKIYIFVAPRARHGRLRQRNAGARIVHTECRGVAVDDGGTQARGPVALRLALLLAARLSHDLSGSLGGLGAALGEAAVDPDALALAQDSAHVLRQRLALFRAAWGGGTGALGREALRRLAAGLPNASRVHLELDALEDRPALAPAAAQVLVSAMLLAAESLPGGGMLALAGRPGGGGRVAVTIAGPRAAWPVGLGAMLASAEAAWEAIAALEEPAGLRVLPAPMTALLAREAGVRASLLLAAGAELVPPLLLDFSAVAAV
jgi:histidine phosphotransferase ChpT